MSQYEDLKKIKQLQDEGILTKAEFDKQKAIILARDYAEEELPTQKPTKSKGNGDAPSGGYLALGLFFPMIGLILFCVWNAEYPQRAKSAGKGALIGAIIWLVLGILIPIILGIILAANVPSFTNSPSYYW